MTSETGAAVKDIVRTIKNKNDHVSIAICPVLVQGPAAAEDIAEALNYINRDFPDTDIIIVGRGGGSMEELWAFNEETVARSIYSSQIPVISAVGHETDFTIADFTADVRAATPTAAAELAVPDTAELKAAVNETGRTLSEYLKAFIEFRRNRLEALDPKAFSQVIGSRIAYEQVNADRIMEIMHDSLTKRIAAGKERTEILRDFIESSNPRAILKRGYAVVTDKDGAIVKTAADLHPGQAVSIQTGEGSANAEITEIL